MSLLHWLSAPANVPFTIAALATLLFGAIQASGVMGLFGGHHESDADADADVDGDVDGDADGDADSDAAPSLGDALFAPLAIGRVPLSFTAQTFSISFAASGLVMNAVFLRDAAVPLITLAWTTPGALLIGYFAASLAARLALPVLDDRAQAATNRHQLVGAIGVVISTTVNEEFGEVRVRDRSGHDVRLIVKLAPHSRVLREREEAVIVDLDESGTLFVAPLHTLPLDASLT